MVLILDERCALNTQNGGMVAIVGFVRIWFDLVFFKWIECFCIRHKEKKYGRSSSNDMSTGKMSIYNK